MRFTVRAPYIACYYSWRGYVKRNWMRHAYVKPVVASVTERRSKMYGNENLYFRP